MAIKIQFAIVAAIFDYNPKISAAIKPEYWEKCMPAVETLLEVCPILMLFKINGK